MCAMYQIVIVFIVLVIVNTEDTAFALQLQPQNVTCP